MQSPLDTIRNKQTGNFNGQFFVRQNALTVVERCHKSQLKVFQYSYTMNFIDVHIVKLPTTLAITNIQ